MKISYKLIATLILLSLLLGSCIQQKDTFQNPMQDSYFRIIVPKTGYYQIAMYDLIKLGLSDPDTSKLSLYHMGKPYPFWIVESDKIEDSIIYFYAPPSDKASNIKETIFILAFDDRDTDNRLYPINVPKEADQDSQPSMGTITQHLEDQNLYLPDSKGFDHWYWAMITHKDEIEVKFSIPELDSLNMKIRAQL